MQHTEFDPTARTKVGEVFEPETASEIRAYKNAHEVLSLIRDGVLDAGLISRKDRLPVVAFLRLEGRTIEEISTMLQVSASTIDKDLKEISKDRARIIKRIDLHEVAGRFVTMAKHLSAKARREGSYATSWKIEKEMLEGLQSLGFVYRAPKTAVLGTVSADIQRGHRELEGEVGSEQDRVVEALDSMLSKVDRQRRIRIEE